MKRSLVFCAVVGAILALNTASASDPPWTPGDSGTTHQEWYFDVGTNPIPTPDVYSSNPVLGSTATLSITGGFAEDTIYYDEFPQGSGHFGVWGFEMEMITSIPNHSELNPLKEIWVQLTYWSDGIPNLFALPEGSQPDAEVMTLIDNTGGNGEWGVATWHVALTPNPTFEEVWIKPVHCTLYVDDLVIDTICTVPEPATFGLLGLGALALLRKRRA